MPENLVYEQLFRKINNLETQANQPFYDIFDVNTFKFTLPEINAVKQNKLNSSGEISEQTAYEQLFRIIISFEKRAEKLENEGSRQRAEFLRNYFRRKSGLTSEQSDALKTYAKSFTSEIGEIKNRYESARQSKTESLFQSENFERERTRLFLDYHNRLKRFLGENGFEYFAKFVQEKVASRLTYRQDVKSNRLLLSMSMVEYNEASDEVLGYSFTNEPGGHDSIWNIVQATLTSDSQGVVDSDSDEQCDQAAEVFLFASGTDAEETFCVDGLHKYAIDRIEWLTGRPKNPPAKTVNQANFGGCYGYEETDELPPSEDCLTTPPLPNVTGVSFQTIAPNSLPIDANPNIGGGRRIFPDDNAPGDMENRQRIRVTAGISEPRAGVTVFFSNFDLDDPSADTIIDPLGNAGNDNHGNVNGSRAGELSAVSAITNSQGMAAVDFTVTMQPGDNFAVAATTNSNELSSVSIDGTNLRTGSGALIDTSCDETDTVCRSEMLTVWRRLHIEVDSMGASAQNFVLGNIAATTRLRVNEIATININPTSPQTLTPLEHNSYEGGRLVVGNNSFPVTCVIANGDTCNTANTVTVKNTGGSIVTLFAGNQFQLFDDDDFDDDDGANPDGDTGEDIPGPDEINATTLLQPNDTLCSQAITTNCNAFAAAYIHPMYDIAGDFSDNTVFQSHLEENINITNVFSQDFDQIGTEASQDFWTILVYGAYQRWRLPDPFPGGKGYDADPPDTNGDGNPDGCPEASYGTTNAFAPNALGASINMEVSRPREYPLNYQSRPVSRAWTLAHEVGHLFGGDHDDGGLMTETCIRSAVTGWAFTPTTIERLRRQIPNP